MVVAFHVVVFGVVVSSLSDLKSRAQPSQSCKMTKFSPKQHNGGSLVTCRRWDQPAKIAVAKPNSSPRPTRHALSLFDQQNDK
jgi:hypothetical protein